MKSDSSSTNLLLGKGPADKKDKSGKPSDKKGDKKPSSTKIKDAPSQPSSSKLGLKKPFGGLRTTTGHGHEEEAGRERVVPHGVSTKDFAAKGPIALLLGELGKLETNSDNELSINLVDCVLQRGALIVTKKTGAKTKEAITLTDLIVNPPDASNIPVLNKILCPAFTSGEKHFILLKNRREPLKLGENPVILCANNVQERDRWMTVLREQTGVDHSTLSEGSNNMQMEFEGAGQSEESDDDLFENWSFHVELANDWQPECKFIPEIPYIAASFVPSFRSNALYTNVICDAIYKSPFESPLEEDYTVDYVNYEVTHELAVEFVEGEDPDVSLMRRIDSSIPGEWGFPFDFIPQLPFAPAESSSKFEIHLENNFLIDSSRSINDEEVIILNSSPFAFDPRWEQRRIDLEMANHRMDWQSIFVFDKPRGPILQPACSPFEVRPIAHLNDLEQFLIELQSQMEENDHGMPSFSIGEPGLYEKLGIYPREDDMSNSSWLENLESVELAGAYGGGSARERVADDITSIPIARGKAGGYPNPNEYVDVF